jgi:hypothetical protein
MPNNNNFYKIVSATTHDSNSFKLKSQLSLFLDKNNLSPIHLAIQNNDIENDNFQNANKVVGFYVVNCIYLQHLRGNDLAVTEFKTLY